QKFGRYELLRHLATGGMAEIYLARISGIQGFEKTVVVKRILPQLSSDKDFVELFLQEARLAATLAHPNIVQVYDVGLVDGEYFFAMEFVHGEDVRAIMNAVLTDPQPPNILAETLTIVLGLCAALQYAHEKKDDSGRPLGIIHRDVSPANVLVSF